MLNIKFLLTFQPISGILRVRSDLVAGARPARRVTTYAHRRRKNDKQNINF